jgi:CRP/FNR family transcriptional regulator, cyclic AMP receptor protein
VGCAETSTFAPGEFLSRQGGRADRVYLICSGQAALEILVPHQGPLHIETIGAGEVLGCAFLVPGRLWHFDTRAITEIHAIRIDGPRLWEKCEQDPSLGYALLKRLAAVSVTRLDATRLRLLDLYSPGLGAAVKRLDHISERPRA